MFGRQGRQASFAVQRDLHRDEQHCKRSVHCRNRWLVLLIYRGLSMNKCPVEGTAERHPTQNESNATIYRDPP